MGIKSIAMINYKDITINNISEYEGLTPDDYPGDNSEYRINDN